MPSSVARALRRLAASIGGDPKVPTVVKSQCLCLRFQRMAPSRIASPTKPIGLYLANHASAPPDALFVARVVVIGGDVVNSVESWVGCGSGIITGAVRDGEDVWVGDTVAEGTIRVFSSVAVGCGVRIK